MSDPYQKRCFQLPRREIAYLRFIVEGYDGLLFLRTLDAAAGLVEIAWPASRDNRGCSLLAALGGEIGLWIALPGPPVGGEGWP